MAGPGEVGRPKIIPRFESWGLDQDNLYPTDLAVYGDLIVHELDGSQTKLKDLWSEKPVLLVHSSLTCPVSRDNCPHVDRIRTDYGDKIQVVVLYTTEAHPVGSPSPYSEGGKMEWITDRNLMEKILVDEPDTISSRIERAREYRKKFGIESRLVVDGLTNKVWQLFGGGPNTGIFISEKGEIIARQGWLKPSLMEGRIRSHFASHSRNLVDEKLKAEGLEIDMFRPKLDEITTVAKRVPEILSYAINNRGAYHDESFLHLAVRNRDLEFVNQLLEMGAPTELKDSSGSTPLHYALSPHWKDSDADDIAVIQLLLNKGASPLARTDKLESATHIAVQSGMLSHVKLALEAGSPLDSYSIDGISPLHEALFQSDKPITKYLISEGSAIDIFAAAGLGDIDTIKRFLAVKPQSWNAFQGDSGRSPLIYAATNGKTETVNFLLSQQNDDLCYSNEQLDACLRKAIVNGHTQVALALANLAHPLAENTQSTIDDGRDIGQLTSFPVRAPVVSEFLMPQAPPNSSEFLTDSPVIHEAASLNRVSVLALLLDRGWHIEGLDPDEETPLHRAASAGSVEVIKLLIDRGANIEAKSGEPEPLPCGVGGPQRKNRTPLHLAVINQRASVVELLVRRGAKVDYNDIDGLPPLAYSFPSSYNDEDREEQLANLKKIVRILIEAGSDPDKPYADGNSYRAMAAELVDKQERIDGKWENVGKEPRSKELLTFLDELKKE